MDTTATTAAVEPTTIALPHILKQEPALHIPLALLAPSPTNPRRKFDQAKLQELADGIRELGGNFQPILARPNPAHTEGDGQPRYEIVAGERRWRACALAGLETVLALVRPLTDRQALQIQLKENLDRESLHELEEAEGIKRLIDETGETTEQIADSLGKGRRWAFGRLALLKLTPEVRELFLADAFKATVAGLIARIPNPDQQLQAAQHIALGWGGEPYSYRAASDWLAKEYMLALAKAPFDTGLTYPVAGPCSACPKRSGAAPDLFEDVKGGDMCQDSKCYQAKAAQHIDHQLAEARAAGHQVLEGDAARRLMISTSSLPHGYHWFDKACPLSTSDKPLRELFGAKARDVVTLHHPSGAIVSIVPETSVRKLLKSKGLLVPTTVPEAPPAPEGEADDDSTEGEAASTQATSANPAAKAPPAAKPKPRTSAELAIETEALGHQLLGQRVHGLIRIALQAQPELPLRALKLLILTHMHDASVEAFRLIYASRGWAMPTAVRTWPHTPAFGRDLEAHIEGLNGRELGELLIETLVLEELTDGLDVDELIDSDHFCAPTWSLCKELRIDEAQLESMAAAAAEAAFQQVRREEDERLGTPADATDAFVQAHAPAAPTAPRSPVKYRNQATGETWSGKGLQPKWLKVALAAGSTLNDFEVTPA